MKNRHNEHSKHEVSAYEPTMKPCKVCRSHPMLMLTIDLCNEKGCMEAH